MSSPYSALKAVDPAGVQAAFRKQLADSLAPLVTEVVSKQTRQLQQQLLVISAFLLLLSFSVIRIKGEATWNGVQFSVVANSAVAIVFVVSFYLELVVTVRSLLDYNAWSIQSGVARLILDEALRFSFVEWLKSRRGSELHAEAVRAGNASRRDRAQDGERLSDVELERRALERKLEREKRALERKLEREKGAAQREELKEKIAWIDSKVAPLRRINALRVGLEVLFPVLFGGVALVLAAVQWLK